MQPCSMIVRPLLSLRVSLGSLSDEHYNLFNLRINEHLADVVKYKNMAINKRFKPDGSGTTIAPLTVIEKIGVSENQGR